MPVTPAPSLVDTGAPLPPPGDDGLWWTRGAHRGDGGRGRAPSSWLTRDEFLDYLGATNLIPGPNSTELAIHIGMARHGWPGLLVAGSCFILPSAVIVGL